MKFGKKLKVEEKITNINSAYNFKPFFALIKYNRNRSCVSVINSNNFSWTTRRLVFFYEKKKLYKIS